LNVYFHINGINIRRSSRSTLILMKLVFMTCYIFKSFVFHHMAPMTKQNGTDAYDD
jgi:hypothetical protein